jgi:hypothetical protein
VWRKDAPVSLNVTPKRYWQSLLGVVKALGHRVVMTGLNQKNRTAFARAACVILAAAITPGFAAPIAPSQATFDGQWSVLIVTEKGRCDRAYRYPVKIQNGAVDYAGTASFTVSGKVDTNGTLSVVVARGTQKANGTGRMSESDGAGTWIAGECSGFWTAERRMSQ